MATSQPPNPVDAMQSRMLRLRDDLAFEETGRPAALEETFQAFGVTLEELRVAEEHLIHSNEILLTTRHQLDRERRRYRELFDLAPDGYLVTDHAGVIRDANRAAAALFNVPQHFMTGKVLANFVPEADRRAFRVALLEIEHDPAPAPWRVRVLPRRGDPVEVEVAVSPGAAPTEEGRELLWLLRDLGGRDRPEAAGRVRAAAERDRLRDLIDAVGVVIWEMDPATDRLTFVSREIEAFLGVPASAWLGAPGGWNPHVHLDDRTMLASLRSRQLTDLSDLEVEYRLMARDGHPVWVREVSRFSTGPGQTPRRLRGVLMNVNKRKRIERRLHFTKTRAESQVRDLELLHELCARLTLSIELTDVLGEILRAVTSVLGSLTGSVSLRDPVSGETRVEASLGLSRDFLEAVGAGRTGETPCSRVLSERRSLAFEDVETAPEFEPVRDVLRQAGLRAVFVVPLLSQTGEALGSIAIYFSEPHRPPDGQQSLVALYARQAGQVVANARRHAAVRVADRRKDELLATVGHEMRDSLAAVVTALGIDATPEADAAVRIAAHGEITRQAQHLARLAENLLATPHPVNPGLSVPNDPTDPSDVVHRSALQDLTVSAVPPSSDHDGP